MIKRTATVACLIMALAPAYARAGAGAASADAGAPRLTLIDVFDRPEQSGLRKVFRQATGAGTDEWLIRPYGIAWDGDDLIVTDPGAGSIARIHRRARTIEFGRAKSAEPLGVAICGGRILVTDGRNGTVEILDKNLSHAGWLARDLARPTGISCLSDTVFVAETAAHRVVAFRPDGSRESFGSRGGGKGQFNFPVAVTTSGDAIFVVDSMNFRVQRLSSADLAFRSEFGSLGDAPGDIARPKGVAIDQRGHVWLTDAYFDQVSVYGADGAYLAGVGSSGGEPGQFSFPAGIAFDNGGQLAVVDSLNRRVQVFRLEFSEHEP